MGTSLSGLTPATTFDGLLKTSDNEPLDGTLRTISDGSGVDSALQLSNSALKITSSLNVDDGNGTTLGNAITIGNDKLRLGHNYNNAIISAPSGKVLLFAPGGIGVGNGYTNADSVTASLGIKGSGATSATTSLLVQNSAGDDSLKITDDNKVLIGNSTTGGIHNVDSASSLPFTVSRLGTVRFSVSADSGNGQIVLKSNTNNEFSVGTNGNIFQINDGTNTNQGSKRFSIIQDGNIGIGDVSPTARLHVKGSGNDNTTTSLLVQNSDGDELMKVTDDSDVTLSKLVTIRNSSAGLFARAYADGYGAGGPLMWVNGSMNLGSSPSTAAKLSVKGSGATSATTALLVQNSAGDDMLKVGDDGGTTIKSFGASNALTVDSSLATSSFEMEAQGQQRFRIQASGSTTRFSPNNTGGITFIGNGIFTGGSFDVPAARLHVKGSGNDNTTTALLVQNSDGDDVLKVQDDGITTFGQNDQSGSTPTGFEFQPNPLNATWGPSIKSYYNNSKWLQIEKGSRYYTFADSGLGINMDATPTARLQVKGSGATSATTALLVQNSAGTEHLKVTDDGVTNVRQSLIVNHATVSSRYLSLGWGAVGANSTADELSLYGGGSTLGSIMYLNASAKNTAPQAIGMKTTGVLIAPSMVQSSFAPDASAQLQVDSTTKGFLPPRMTDAERDAIATPAAGLMIYDTSNNQMNYWNGSTWIAF